MYKVGDKVNFGDMTGEIVDVKTKTWIGFHPHNEVHYDILFRNIPEEAINQEKDGTD